MTVTLCNSRPWKPADLPTYGWVSVLKVSTLWSCLELRALAIEKISVDLGQEKPTNVIKLGRKYFVEDWVVRGYRSVIDTEEELSEKDAEIIGWEESYRIMTLREMRHKRNALSGRGFTGSRSSNRAGSIQDEEIRKAFKTELSCIIAAAAPYNSPPSPTPTLFSCGSDEKEPPNWFV